MTEVDSVAKGAHDMPNSRRQVTRRNALKLGAAATALPLVHIRTAGAAGKQSALWDPGPDRRCRDENAGRCLGREEQSRHRLFVREHQLTMAAEAQ
jgi:hypothetical protein